MSEQRSPDVEWDGAPVCLCGRTKEAGAAHCPECGAEALADAYDGIVSAERAMSDSRREVVARTLYRFVEGTMTDNRMPWPILCDRYPGTAEHYRAMADETLATIDATPGPARDAPQDTEWSFDDELHPPLYGDRSIVANPGPVCPECNGDGEIQHLQAWDIPGAWQRCPACKGAGSTPGPVAVAVSEGHPLVSPALFDVGLDDLADEIERTFIARDGFGYTPDELLELRQHIKDVYRDTYAAALAARTTARAPEPTDAEIEAGARALHNFTQEPSGQDRPWENFPVEYHDLFRERARVVLIAARNAGQGGTE